MYPDHLFFISLCDSFLLFSCSCSFEQTEAKRKKDEIMFL